MDSKNRKDTSIFGLTDAKGGLDFQHWWSHCPSEQRRVQCTDAPPRTQVVTMASSKDMFKLEKDMSLKDMIKGLEVRRGAPKQ